ncbi:Ig-like domain-containing protein [Massilia sp. W12]|uniref:Ig-like domain-containing protein n=1 Tax=Massilia sp. W12 TaxID=3126507 RepID=UPI0030D23ECC
MRTPRLQKAIAHLLLACSLLHAAQPALAATLTVGEGVVLKFGEDAQLVVRDRLQAGKSVLLTSRYDNSAGGALDSNPRLPAPGDWGGMRLEKSAAASSTLEDWQWRYAGGAGQAGLQVRGWNALLNGAGFYDNLLGLRLQDGANLQLSGASWLRNQTGLQVQASQPHISASSFAGNSQWALQNLTPQNSITAPDNWWGHASGPRQEGGNGQGDALSSGVQAATPSTHAPLLYPRLRLAQAPAPFSANPQVRLWIACQNATEYRIAEQGAFSNLPFSALPPTGEAYLDFTLSAQEGHKELQVQFRNPQGQVVSASLAGGIWYDRAAPQLSLRNPAPGSLINRDIVLEAEASDSNSVASVEFFLNQTSLARINQAPWRWNWAIAGAPEGSHRLRAVARDAAGRTVERSVQISIAHGVPPADTDGPSLENIKLDGQTLADGMRIGKSADLTLDASDRSGVARIALLLDGTEQSVVNSGGSQRLRLNLDGVADGAHTLSLQARDSLGNHSTRSFALQIAHAAPDAPQWLVSGGVTRHQQQDITGRAAPGSKVTLRRNQVELPGDIYAGGDGRFNATVQLSSGPNRIQARASDQYGSGDWSAELLYTLDQSMPAAPQNLTLQAQAAGKLRLSWSRSADASVAGYLVYRANQAFEEISRAQLLTPQAISGASFDDLPPQEGLWHYRIVAQNAAGTQSALSNAAQGIADASLPRVPDLVSTSLGRVEQGRIGQGRVNVELRVSESLGAAPYLALVPQGGHPISIDLQAGSQPDTWQGSFAIDANTPAGLAHYIFSARDAAGNRGSQIERGGSLQIDTRGPELRAISIQPGAPVNNQGNPELRVTLEFDKALQSAPEVKYRLGSRDLQAISGWTQGSGNQWQNSFRLPADAGQSGPENLSFSFTARDSLDNLSSRIAAANSFQVYQGALPPLANPLGFTAKAQAGGKVKLSWQAVDSVFAYQLYRQAPGESELQPLGRASGLELIDATPRDGLYRYAIASVRRAGDTEAVSDRSESVSVQARATAPGAPGGLLLLLSGQGIYANWQAPASGNVDYYNLYRAGGTKITSIEGMTPYKTRIKGQVTFDTNPSPEQGAYVVTAVDAAGNESAISNSFYLNVSLLPVRQLLLEQIGNQLPQLSWQAPNQAQNGNLAGYHVYLDKPEGGQLRLTPQAQSANSFSDAAYSGGERRYSIATVDATGVEVQRSIQLPALDVQIVAGLPLKRGLMNQLQVQISNRSQSALNGVRAMFRLPGADGRPARDHYSAPLGLAPGQSSVMMVTVGGYAELDPSQSAQLGVEIASGEGELVRLLQSRTLEVVEGALVVNLAASEVTRGGVAKLRLTVENNSDVELEWLTARQHGTKPSDELRFKILDGDGNLLASQPYQQVFGSSVVTLGNGDTVARIAAGSRYESEEFNLNIPSASPNEVRLRLEVDSLRYHSGREDEIKIAGRVSERLLSLKDTAYYAEVSSVSPAQSFGDSDILIRGRALERHSRAPLPNARVKLVINQEGFERQFYAVSDESGNFQYSYKPAPQDGGEFRISALHPVMTERNEQQRFVISRISLNPARAQLDIPKNARYRIPLKISAGPASAANNLRLALNPASQPTGQIPQGVNLELPAPLSLQARQNVEVALNFQADDSAISSGALILDLHSDERPDSPIAQWRLDYKLSDARPYLMAQPAIVEAGMARNASQIEGLQIKNNGLQAAANLRFALLHSNGAPAPAWARLLNQADGDLAIGASRQLDLHFSPDAQVDEGVYQLKLEVTGDNLPPFSVPVYVSVTQSGQGSVLFKAANLYTATPDRNGRLIPGLVNATVSLQNEEVATQTWLLQTDAQGEALFENIPAGRYKYRVKADRHQEAAGRLTVRPGVNLKQPVFLEYKLVTVEWSVREVTLQDRYEITLNATYETDVPAAVLMMHPVSVNLPKMRVGDVYYGELVLTNFGLVRAENVRQKLPKSDAYFRFEFLTEVPAVMEAKQRVNIPYRVIALQSREQANSNGLASGGGCDHYSNNFEVSGNYTCGNGNVSSSSASASWFSADPSCRGEQGYSGSLIDYGSSSRGTSNVDVTPASQRLKGTKCVFIPNNAQDAQQCKQ